MNLDERLHDAIQSFWTARTRNTQRQQQKGKPDAGTRGAVTAGTQLAALESLVTEILVEAGVNQSDVKTKTALELPGYYRPEKKWDLLVVSKNRLMLAMEFKSHVGPSFGNNFNNRSEEVLGSATCIWTAFREGRFGANAAPPFLGYLFLLEDCPKVHQPVKNREPNFGVDPVFKGALVPAKGRDTFPGVSYSKRYEILCRRLILERLYSSACLLLSTNANPTRIAQPASDLSFQRFVAALRGHVLAFFP